MRDLVQELIGPIQEVDGLGSSGRGLVHLLSGLLTAMYVFTFGSCLYASHTSWWIDSRYSLSFSLSPRLIRGRRLWESRRTSSRMLRSS